VNAVATNNNDEGVENDFDINNSNNNA